MDTSGDHGTHHGNREPLEIEWLTDLSVSAARIGTLAELFATDPGRADWLTVEACGILADFSRQRIDRDLFDRMVAYAGSVSLWESLASMFAGETVNTTEGRAALHVACRADPGSSTAANEAHAQLVRARDLAEAIRNSTEVSSAGRRFDAVVNIGIGGSDLGPAMVARALRRVASGPDVRFVSNVDAADLDEALVDLDPASTLFVVSSKTFTTLETIHNANRARQWSAAAGGDWTANFVGATADETAAVRWGIRPERCLRFFEWVGGRFSVSSVIGFPVMCRIGAGGFTGFLEGMAAMDDHVRNAPPHANLAFVHAVTWFVNHVLHGHESVAVVPYSHDLARLPAFLQQLVMESNGKSTAVDGTSTAWSTCPVVWGEPGTNGQHAFFQMLHQGSRTVPVEFIGSLAPLGSDERAHDLLMANMFAQSEALAVGRSTADVRASGEREDLVAHKTFPGSRPSSVLMIEELSPRVLGALVAMYEHSTVLQGWMVGVNSFDQWGVELGKVIAARVADHLDGSVDSRSDGGAPLAFTGPLVEWYRRSRPTRRTGPGV